MAAGKLADTFSPEDPLLLMCGCEHDGLPSLCNLGQDTNEPLKKILQRKVTVIVQVDVDNTLRVCK